MKNTAFSGCLKVNTALAMASPHAVLSSRNASHAVPYRLNISRGKVFKVKQCAENKSFVEYANTPDYMKV